MILAASTTLLAGSRSGRAGGAPRWALLVADSVASLSASVANGALSLLPGSTPAGGPNGGAVDARLSPDGGFLYVDQAKAHAVAAFAVNGGRLTQLHTSPFPPPAGATPAGIVIS